MADYIAHRLRGDEFWMLDPHEGRYRLGDGTILPGVPVSLSCSLLNKRNGRLVQQVGEGVWVGEDLSDGDAVVEA